MTAADNRLAILIPRYGVGSETFIRKYCETLAPSAMAVIAFDDVAGGWRVDAPSFILSRRFFGLRPLAKAWQAGQRLARRHSLFDDPITSRRLAAFVKENRIDRVFSQYMIGGWNIHAFCKRHGLRHVVRGHGFDLSISLRSDLWRERYLDLADADAIIVPSPYQKENLVRLGLPEQRIHTAPCGVELPELPPKKASGRETISCLAVGRLVAKKAPAVSVKAFLSAAERDDRLRLTVIGDGPLRPELEVLVSSHPLGGRVELLGACDHRRVIEYFRSSDVFVQHSVTDPETGDQEGAPVAILEAMAYGLPVIATRHSGIPYLAPDGECGFLVDEFDETAMADRLTELSQNPDRMSRFGENGRARARDRFTYEHERVLIRRLLGDAAN